MTRVFWCAVTLTLLAACNEQTADPQPVSPSVSSLTVISGETEVAGLNPLKDGATLDLSALPATSLSLAAKTQPETVGSVRFTLGDASHTDDTAPYTFGSADGLALTPGQHTVTATAFGEAQAAGTAGSPHSVAFSVVGGGLMPEPAHDQRLLYVITRGSPNLWAYDMDDGYRLVKKETLRELEVSRTWGAVAYAPSGILYLSHHNRDGEGGAISPGILAYDLVNDKVLWRKTYKPFVDSLELTPDGKTIYMASGEATGEGTFWFVVDAATGEVKDKIEVYRGAHNTVVGMSGKQVYLGGVHYPYLVVADTATNDVIREIGPFHAGIRPFTVNGAETLAYVNTNQLNGFEVGDIKTGKKLYSVTVKGYPSANYDEELDVQSHGVALTPDEREVWVVDGSNKYLHIFDVTGVPASAPVQKESIALESAPVWVSFSRDGRFAHISTGDVIDTKTREIVAKTASSKMRLQIDFKDGKPVAAYSRYGLGYAAPDSAD